MNSALIIFERASRRNNHPVNTLASVHDSCVTIAAANCFQDPDFDPALGITTRSSGPGGTALYQSCRAGLRSGTISRASSRRRATRFSGLTITRSTFSKHTLKFGVDVRRQRFDQFLFFDVSGEYTITSNANQDQIASDQNFPFVSKLFSWRTGQLHAGRGATGGSAEHVALSFCARQLQDKIRI